MSEAEVELDLEVKADDMRSRTTYILLFLDTGFLDRSNEAKKRREEGEKHSGFFFLVVREGIFAGFLGKASFLRRKGSSLSFRVLLLFALFARDGHKMVLLYPNQVTRVFAVVAFCSFSKYSDLKAIWFGGYFFCRTYENVLVNYFCCRDTIVF